jgi:NADP-dependent 3-hydroxy acid dehydrogenase YdfG
VLGCIANKSLLFITCMAMRLSGKTALVTGGATGIGYGIACALASEDCRTVIAGRRDDALRAAVEGCKTGQLLRHRVDVADPESVKILFAWANQQLGRIDILVNAAGVNIKNRTMTNMDPSQWDYVMNINAAGVYHCMYAVLPQMRERKDGLIINISSISGKRASPLGGVAYNASKFAVEGLSIAVANEERGNNIRITSILPGEVETPILEHRPEPVSDERRATMLQPEDVAALVLTIASLPPRAHVPELIIKPTVQEFI